MSTTLKTDSVIGKNKTKVQAVIHKSDRDLLQKLANVQDRSESYIIAKIIEDYLHGEKVVRSRSGD